MMGCEGIGRSAPEKLTRTGDLFSPADFSQALEGRHRDISKRVEQIATSMAELRDQSARHECHLQELLGLARAAIAPVAPLVDTSTYGLIVAAEESPRVLLGTPLNGSNPLGRNGSNIEGKGNLRKASTSGSSAPEMPFRSEADLHALHHLQATPIKKGAFAEVSQAANKVDAEAAAMDAENISPPLHILTRIVFSPQFDMLSGTLVVLNSVIMAAELEWMGTVAASELGEGPRHPSDSWQRDMFWYLEHIFCWLFTVELLIRIICIGRRFFRHCFNMLDLFIVCASLIEIYLLGLMDIRLPNVTVLRLLRLIKLVKAIRVVRMMGFIHPLRLLVVSFIASIGSLWWSMVFLSILMFIASIGITQVIHEFIMDPTGDLELRIQVFEYFGSWSSSMLTMFQMTIAPGAWITVGRLVIFKVNYMYIWFFVSYLWLVTFAVMRVITAIFLQQTMKAVARDDDIANHEQVVKQNRESHKIRDIFEAGDTDGGGDMCQQEFKTLFRNPHVVRWLRELGLEIDAASGIFELMDDGDGKVTYDEFISGILRLRGGAKTVDLATLLHENKRIRSMLNQIAQDLHYFRGS